MTQHTSNETERAERELFEAAMCDLGIDEDDLEFEDGQYPIPNGYRLWQGWQAGRDSFLDFLAEGALPVTGHRADEYSGSTIVYGEAALRQAMAIAASAPPMQVAPRDDAKRLNAYATLVKAKEGQIAHLQAALAKQDEAVNTLASEREANALLTAEVDALRAAVPQVAPEQASVRDAIHQWRDPRHGGWHDASEEVAYDRVDDHYEARTVFLSIDARDGSIRDAALEEAAETCENLVENIGDAAAYDDRDMSDWELERMETASKCADAIRALISKGAIPAQTGMLDQAQAEPGQIGGEP